MLIELRPDSTAMGYTGPELADGVEARVHLQLVVKPAEVRQALRRPIPSDLERFVLLLAR
jgi:hypothetical protein